MTTFLVGVSVVLVIIASVFCVLWKIEQKIRKDTQKDLADSIENNKVLMEQLNKLHEELRIKNENREEADAKVNALHNGDSVSNAINGLSKH